MLYNYTDCTDFYAELVALVCTQGTRPRARLLVLVAPDIYRQKEDRNALQGGLKLARTPSGSRLRVESKRLHNAADANFLSL